MKLREVDPLEPQPGDRVRIYTPFYMEDPDHPMNWDAGTVDKNSVFELVLHDGQRFQHNADKRWGSIYYIVEEA